MLCWGSNKARQRTVPNLLQSGKVLECSLGNTHSCVVRAGGTAKCWGDGKNGQLEVGE